MDNKEKEQMEDWVNDMVKELNTEEKLRADLEDYWNMMQVNQKVIFMLSKGLLSKPNYHFQVFKDFFNERIDEATETVQETSK